MGSCSKKQSGKNVFKSNLPPVGVCLGGPSHPRPRPTRLWGRFRMQSWFQMRPELKLLCSIVCDCDAQCDCDKIGADLSCVNTAGGPLGKSMQCIKTAEV